MTLSFLALLQLVLSLLLLIQNSPAATDAMRQRAVIVASQATELAAGALQQPAPTSTTSSAAVGAPSASTTTSTYSTSAAALFSATSAVGSSSPCADIKKRGTINHSRSVVDDVACFQLAADASGQTVVMQGLALTFSGEALEGVRPFSVSLMDPATGVAYGGSSATPCSPSPSASCKATFTFTSAYLTPGEAKNLIIRVNSAGFMNTTQLDGLDITIASSSDLVYADSSGVPQPPVDNAFPLFVAHIDYE